MNSHTAALISVTAKQSMLKFSKRAVGVALVITLAACSSEQLNKFNNDLAALNAGMAGTGTPAAAKPGTMAVSTASTDKTAPTKLIVPNDPHTKAAMDAALPNVKKILAIHQCVKVDEGMLQLNYYTVPGVSIRDYGNYPDHQWFMKYHDKNKCVGVQAIDSWTMPAMNALQFRAVYFAEDSGETVSFGYLMKKTEDGSWKL
jgi:hypothetical protein